MQQLRSPFNNCGNRSIWFDDLDDNNNSRNPIANTEKRPFFGIFSQSPEILGKSIQRPTTPFATNSPIVASKSGALSNNNRKLSENLIKISNNNNNINHNLKNKVEKNNDNAEGNMKWAREGNSTAAELERYVPPTHFQCAASPFLSVC